MDSNEHGTMEQNEEHLVTNISIYYTHETELYAESYGAMNRSISCKYLKTEKFERGEKSTKWISPDRILRRALTFSLSQNLEVLDFFTIHAHVHRIITLRTAPFRACNMSNCLSR